MRAHHKSPIGLHDDETVLIQPCNFTETVPTLFRDLMISGSKNVREVCGRPWTYDGLREPLKAEAQGIALITGH